MKHLLIAILIAGVVGCGGKDEKKLIVVIDDERCGNKMMIYSFGDGVIVDSLDRNVLPIDVPIYIVSHGDGDVLIPDNPPGFTIPDSSITTTPTLTLTTNDGKSSIKQ